MAAGATDARSAKTKAKRNIVVSRVLTEFDVEVSAFV